MKENAPPAEVPLDEQLRKILEEVVTTLNLEQILPSRAAGANSASDSCGSGVTRAALGLLSRLERVGASNLQVPWQIYAEYTRASSAVEVRCAALELLADALERTQLPDLLAWFLDVLDREQHPSIRLAALTALIKRPPFTRHLTTQPSLLDTQELSVRLSQLIQCALPSFY